MNKTMSNQLERKINGIEKLVKKYRKIFKIPENLNYYSEEDYKIAERKYLKHRLNGKDYTWRIKIN